MAKRGGSAHVATIKTKGKGGVVYTSHLLRRSYREGGKVRHENLGNLSHLPVEIIDGIRAMLAGRRLVDLDEDFEIKRSLPHGHVAAVLGVLRDLDLQRPIGRDACRERELVIAMIVQRLIAPGSKLSATRRFAQTTLSDELGAMCATLCFSASFLLTPASGSLRRCAPSARLTGSRCSSPRTRG
jgi:hypothetical protein